MTSLAQQIKSAQEEMATWPQWKRDAAQLEGMDIYYERAQREAAERAAIQSSEVEPK